MTSLTSTKVRILTYVEVLQGYGESEDLQTLLKVRSHTYSTTTTLTHLLDALLRGISTRSSESILRYELHVYITSSGTMITQTSTSGPGLYRSFLVHRRTPGLYDIVEPCSTSDTEATDNHSGHTQPLCDDGGQSLGRCSLFRPRAFQENLDMMFT